MRHQVAGRKFDRPTAQRMLMLRTMVTDFIRHETMQTTDAKAREVKKLAEHMITLAKKGTLHHRRQAAAFMTDEGVVKKLFAEIGPRYSSRPGGYTRLVKLGPRKGDAAMMAIIELMP